MKTKVSFISRMVTMTMALFMTASMAFADGDITDVYTTGTSNSPAGDFVVQTTGDLFHFQGETYNVYKVYYDDPSMNLKIAVNTDGKCKSFVAYNDEYTIFYKCNRNGFGVRKVMFANTHVKDRFDAEEFHQQTILKKKKRIEKKEAVELIAAFLPMMQTT